MTLVEDVGAALARVVAGLPGGGEERSGQRDMAAAVARAAVSGRHLVVRAGTGTGKSLGYLLPAVLSGRRVVVATATKALQDQLAGKDLPMLAESLGERFDFAVLKGRSNYLCRQRLREASARGEAVRLEDAPRAGGLAEQARSLARWAESTETGDRAELGDEPDPRLWSAYSVTAEECPGRSRCPSGGDCFAESARERALAAQVAVVNLHLLGADLASEGALLGLEDDALLVVDEAHELEDVLTASLGARVSPGRLRALASMARAVLPPRRGADTSAVAGLVEAADQLDDALGGLRGQRLRTPGDGVLGAALELSGTRLERLASELQREVERLGSAGGEQPGAPEAARALLATGHLREDLARLLALDDDHVAWVSDGQHAALELAPIDVAPILADRVFAKHPVVLTSATVPPGLAARLGADPARTDELDVGSPFAYEEQALLYCAAHLPDRRRPEAEPAIVEELVALVEAAGGRTLALFTSRAVMERVAAAVRERVPHPLLVQGERSKGALVEEFRSVPESSLFATMGFWQGVDVPGATCSLVVIDRIPFARPDDPLTDARRDRAGADAFRVVDLPRAASLLAQGAGRLLRTATDRGVVAVLDSRLATASYRWDLVRALPPMRRTKSRDDVAAFLAQLRREALEAERSSANAPRTRPR